MEWRRPTFGEMWEIALVVVVLLAGTLLIAGMPSTARNSGMQPDWACVAPVEGDPACSHHAERSVMEGRAVRKGLARDAR